MENNKPANNEIQIELSEEMAQGTYANLAIISHSSSEFILDFIRVVPGAPKAQVKSRVILTPDNAQRLLFALQDNIKKFGEQLQAGNNNNKTANFRRSDRRGLIDLFSAIERVLFYKSRGVLFYCWDGSFTLKNLDAYS